MAKSPLLTINDPRLIQSGIVRAPHPLNVPLWIDGENMNFSEGKAWKSRGWSSAFTTGVAVPIRGVLGQRLTTGIQEIDVNRAGGNYSIRELPNH